VALSLALVGPFCERPCQSHAREADFGDQVRIEADLFNADAGATVQSIAMSVHGYRLKQAIDLPVNG